MYRNFSLAISIFRETNLYFYSLIYRHTVLAISTKSPENKDLEILDFLIKIDFDITFTL